MTDARQPSVPPPAGAWPERVVVGVDASAESIEALHRALELAVRAEGTVIVVHAVGLLEEGSFRPRPDLDEIVRRASEHVDVPPGLVEPPLFEDGPPADVLVRVAKRVGGDLLVVGTRGIGAAARPLGSTSDSVLLKASVPVLVVPALPS